MKIGVLGIGGIGGFIGAPLARFYTKNQTEVEIVFICRGKTKTAVSEKGLIFHHDNKTEFLHPHLVSDNPNEIGELDVLIMATKSYALIEALEDFNLCLNSDSVVITLQNMVNSKDLIFNKFDKNLNLLEGCIYVASNIKAPGNIEHLGGSGKIFVGGVKEKNEHTELLSVMKAAGIDISYEEEILPVLWKKYLFVAPVATITTAYDVTFGELLENKPLMLILEDMMKELRKLAISKGIKLTNKDIETALSLLSKFPFESKSSLQIDYEKNKPNEKEFLINYVIEECIKEDIHCPTYHQTNKLI
ncbi:MAG: 2-dehydropantoate 2-reductase [Saonia sp.]